MTQEQKERAYDEALKRAKECHVDGLSLHQPVKDVLEYIFPELAESEDERIRKRIILCLEECVHNDIIRDYEKDKCLAWLEKQNGTPMDVMDIEKQYDIDVLEKHITKDSISELAHTVIVRNGWEIVDAKEQKLVEKKELKKIVVPIFNIGDTIIDKDFYECGTETIKDIKDGQYIFTDGYSINIDEQEGWQLVKASANIERNSTEWSEEDERERKRIIGLLEGWLSTFKETCYAEDCKCGIDWLKSLKERYTWKPSKEQIRTLEYYMHNLACSEHKEVLFGLYEQLKKLSE